VQIFACFLATESRPLPLLTYCVCLFNFSYVKERATVPPQATSFWPMLALFCESIARLLLVLDSGGHESLMIPNFLILDAKY